MIHAWGITDKGAVRTQNQDGFYLDVPSEHLAVGVVCDGMGGAKAGNIASLIAVGNLRGRRCRALQPDGDGEAGPAAVLSAGGGDRQHGSLPPGRHRPGLLAAWAPLWWRPWWWSRPLICSTSATAGPITSTKAGITRLTRDHSVVEDMVARGDITPEEARTSSPEEPHHPGTGL